MTTHQTPNNNTAMYKLLLSIAGAILLLGLASFFSFVQGSQQQLEDHETRITTIEEVQKERDRNIQRSLDEIKADLKEHRQKEEK